MGLLFKPVPLPAGASPPRAAPRTEKRRHSGLSWLFVASPGSPAKAFRPRRWLAALVGFAFLHLSHPLAWGLSNAGLWFAPLGIGLALVAWLGPAAGLLVAADGLLLGFQAWMSGTGSPAGVLGEACGTALTAVAGWWVYARATRRNPQLCDPHSAMMFLFLVPGAVVGLASLLRLALWALAEGGEGPLHAARAFLSDYWLPRALGVLALTPFLLLTVTPWVVRWGVVSPELRRLNPESVRPPGGGKTRSLLGDWIEIAGLVLGTGAVGLVLAVTYGRGEFTGWRLWGLPLLFIVWASLRQGIHAGLGVVTAAALLCLAAEPWVGGSGAGMTSLRGNLLAQCCTALLVGASVTRTRANEARYRQVIGHIPIVLYSARVSPAPQPGNRPRVEITFVSPASRPLLGCRPEDLHGDFDRWLQHVHPQDRELVAAAHSQLFLAGKPVSCEYRLAPALKPENGKSGRSEKQSPNPGDSLFTSSLFPTASECWVRDSLVPHVGADGQVEGWEGFLEDITKQRQLAQDLRRTTSMFHVLVANLPAGVFFVHGPSGQPILVNTRARQLLGQREDHAAGLAHLSQVYRLFRPDGSPYPYDELPVSRALRQGLTIMRDDIVVHRPDGRQTALVTWAAPIDLGGRGQPDAAVWVLEDLTTVRQAQTERLRTIETLRASEEKYRGLVESLPLMLFQADRNLRLTSLNPFAQTLTGYTLAQFRELGDWKAIAHPDDLPNLRAGLTDGLAGQTGQVEFRCRAKDGSEKVCHAIYQPLRHNQEAAGVTLLAVDMTRQRRLEGELRRAQRLELVGRLASGIAHDFNNLLTVILSLADLARERLPEDHPIRHDLRRIGDAGDQAARLAGQLLAFSKQRQVATHPVDLNSVTATTLDLLRSSLPCSITVEANLAGGELWIKADETQLQQVLMNLCLNSRDAMPDGGRLLVQTSLSGPPQIEDRSSTATWVRLTVTDTGQGMEQMTLSRIFDPFFSTKERGTGLGLAVVQQIIQGFGGKVEVSSQLGKGTRFDIWLPKP
jgi:PAS domain S-box-containing protein